MIEWELASAMLERTCPVCRLASPQTLLAIVAGQQVSRCPECGSVHTGVEPAAMTESDEAIDSYLVQTAGLGTIADTVARGWFEGARTVLDVGCGYGFGADLARVLLDAQAQGVEPSQAGRRGAQELGLRIDAELLTSDSEVGGPFDVVILSEVLEHVEDPAALLAVVRRQVADQGRLTLTTPAAEIVGPHSPPDSVLQALSVGFHAFLASADGLQQLLENAGFAQVWLRRVGGTLQAVASPSPSAAAPPRPASVPATDLERYLSTRAMAAPPGSALAEGLAVRWLRSVVSRGAFDGVTAPREVVAAVYDERHGFDPRIPTAARDVFTRLGPAGTPLSLGGLAFALGMVALLADRDRALAAEHFRLAADVLAEQRSARVLVDADSADILSNSLTHCALALAGLAGTALDVAELLTRVGATNDGHTAQSWRCRVFTEAVAAGHYNDAAHLRPATVDSVWPLLDADDTGLRAVGCTALFSLAMLELHTGDPRSAAAQFRLCAERCQSERFPQLTDLEENARRHIEIAAQRSPATTHPSVAIKGVDGADTVHLETYWCDAYGVFVAGFVSTPDSIVRLGVQTGGSVVWTIPFDRTDVQRIGAADSSRCGFEAYVPGRHAGRFTVHVHTEHGVTTVDGELPTASLPAIKDSTNTRSEILPMLYAAVRHRPPGPILVLGSRVPDGQESIPDLIRRELGTEVLGVDIHPGPGVDVVCDAHRLSALFGEATCAAVVSLSLLEHLAAPWIVAAECARVLAPGGVAVHVVPWTWPTHAAPNDFWRIAPEGLAELFRGLGFEVDQTLGIGQGVVIPGPDTRTASLRMPTTHSALMSFVVARRLPGVVPEWHWPYDSDAGRELAERYPADGVVGWQRMPGDDVDAQPRPVEGLTPRSRTRTPRGRSAPESRITVGVVLPVYNGAAYVLEALASVFGQSRPPDVVVVVDDGSTDDSVAVVQRSRWRDAIRVIRTDNHGQSSARNTGIAAVGTDLVALLDQDDRWTRNHLRMLVPLLARSPRTGYAYSDFDEIDDRGRVVASGFHRLRGAKHPHWSLTELLASDLMIPPSATVLRVSAVQQVGGFDPQLQGYEDDDLIIRLFRAGWKPAYLPARLAQFRVYGSSGSSSSTSSTFVRSRIRFLDKLIAEVPDNRQLRRFYVRDLVHPRLYNTTLDEYVTALTNGDHARARMLAAAADDIARRFPVSTRRRVGLALLSHPPLARTVLEARRVLPAPVRERVYAGLEYRHELVVRPGGFVGRRGITREKR